MIRKLTIFSAILFIFSNCLAQDSLNINIQGEVELFWNAINDFEKVGDLGIFATQETGIVIADISNPENLRELGRIEGNFKSVDIINDSVAACIDISNQSLDMIDFSDPENPETIISNYLNIFIPNVSRSFLADGYIFINSSYFLYVFSIDENYVIEWEATNPVSRYFSYNDYLLYDFNVGFEIWDYRDVVDVHQVSILPVEFFPDKTLYYNGYVYIAARSWDSSGPAFILTADVSDINNPAYVDTLLIDSEYRRATVDMAIVNGFLVVSDLSSTRVFDISTPDQPELLNFIDINSGTFYMVEGDNLYHSTRTSNVLASHVNNTGQLTELYKMGKVAVARDMVRYKNFLLIISDNFLTVLDINNSDNPVRLFDYPDIAASAISLNENLLFTANTYYQDQNINIYSLENPESLELLSSIGPFDDYFITDITADESFLYVALNTPDNHGRIEFYDISDPAQPVRFKVFNPELPVTKIEYHNQFLVVCFGGRNNPNFTLFRTYDITNPAIIEEIYEDEESLIWGPMFFEAGNMFKTYQSSDENMTEISAISDNYSLYQIPHQYYVRTGFDLNGSYLYSAFDTQYSSRMEIFDCLIPEAAQLVAYYENGANSWRLETSGNYIYGLKLRDLQIFETTSISPLNDFSLLMPDDMEELNYASMSDVLFAWESCGTDVSYKLECFYLDDNLQRNIRTYPDISDTSISLNLLEDFGLEENVNYVFGWNVLAVNDNASKESTNSRRFVAGHWNNVETNSINSRPQDFSLDKIYPNPFNSRGTISFTLSQKSKINIKIYNLIGEEVTAVIDYIYDAGRYSVNFDASDLASGIYFCRMTDNNHCVSKKMLLIR